jgi:predicted exporter
LILNLSTLPGLGQLGSLVAIGIVLAAFVMLYGYLPPLLRMRRQRDLESAPSAPAEKLLLFPTRKLLPKPVVWLISLLLLLASIVVLWRSAPQFDHSPNVLKPKNSAASAALEQIKARFQRTEEPLWVLIPGKNETGVAKELAQVNAVLSQAVSNQLIAGFTLPTALWPQPENQGGNRGAVRILLQEHATLRGAALSSGFTTNSLLLTDSILDHWNRALESTNVFWPANRASRWVLSKVVARPDDGLLALGLIHPTSSPAATKRFAVTWPIELQRQGVILSGWELLGTTVFDVVVREMPRVMIPIFLLVLLSLWLAFRSFKEVALSLITLAFSALLLWAAMGVLGWEWNILNLMGLPLLLGMGVDFSIHIQLGLRRYQGHRLTVHRSVGRALLLAGATTVAGFTSLTFSTNAGMASLGKVCALGITLALVVAVYLLPVWWSAWANTKRIGTSL